MRKAIFANESCNLLLRTEDIMAAVRQRHINADELLKFLKSSIEPFDDNIYGSRYRAAVRLLDGTHLPCVVFQSRKSQVELALRRFDQLRSQPSQYNMVVETFVASGSRIDDYQLAKSSHRRMLGLWPS